MMDLNKPGGSDVFLLMRCIFFLLNFVLDSFAAFSFVSGLQKKKIC